MQAYIIQVVLFQLLFIVVYEVLLKKETFFSYNRGYLLLTPVLAFLIPFLKIELLGNVIPDETIGVMLPEVVLGNVISQSVDPGSAEMNPALTTFNWWALLYISGMLVSLFIFIKKYVSLSRMFKYQQVRIEKEFKIIEIPNSTIACTFFKTIFLGASLSAEEKQSIISHELIHVKQRHSIDLLFFELLRIIFWFNPLVYIYQSHITGVHEFLADKEVVKHTEKKQYYQQLLNTAFNTQNISFINQFFNHSLIKKRIVMLQKSQSKTIAKFKYLIILPLILLMLTYVSCSEQEDSKLSTTNSVEIENNNVTLKVKDLQNLTEQEKEKMDMYISEIAAGSNYNSLKIIDGEKSITIGPSGNMKVERVNNKSSNKLYNADVPFAVIDQVPIYPGCEGLASNEEQKKCMSDKIMEHVQKNFNTSMGKELGLTGVNRVIVQFKINKNGEIVDVKSRAPHPKLKEEASRVINSLPQMIPGEQNGTAVGVMYSLPIVFQVAE